MRTTVLHFRNMSFKRDHVGGYELLDSGNMRKLEAIGPYRIIRPSPQAIWSPRLSQSEWEKADAVFRRNESGDGHWEWRTKVEREFDLLYNHLFLHVQLTNFGHMGLFAEQANNWDWLREKIRSRLAATNNRNLHVLNLFAYTGGSTLAASQAGAHVVHLDASKNVVDWARKNARLCHLDQRPIRWIVDDALKFAKREIRRGNKYQGIILDPPSFGRGPKGEVFKIEKHLPQLFESVNGLLANDPLFVLYSCHTPGFTPITMENQLTPVVSKLPGQVESGEMTIQDRSQRQLPSGAFARWVAIEESATTNAQR